MFRERNPLPLGLTVIVWLVATVALVVNIDAVVAIAGRNFTVQLPEAAGLKQGDPVRLNGMDVGRVGDVALGAEYVEAEFSVTDAEVSLGSETSVEVSVETVLGDKALELHPAGDGELEAGAVIPVERAAVPYDVTEALSDLHDEAAPLDTEKVRQALGVVSETVGSAAPGLRPAITGVARISRVIEARDEQLQELLGRADQFSAILADRSGDLTALLRDGNLLFQELLARRDDITLLLTNVSAMARELTGLVADNRDAIGPALTKLNRVLANLDENKGTITQVLQGLGKYITALGETVSSGPLFSGYLQNLLPGNLLLPQIDLAARTGLTPGGDR